MSVTASDTRGPFCYKNWRAALGGAPWVWIFEFPLFTDAHIIGEIASGLGPYQIINAGFNQTNRPALILRVHQHLHFDIPLMTKTQAQGYHGGDEVDEMAALLSLCLGIRIKAGGASRIFDKDGDAMGRPISFGFGTPNDPNLVATRPRLNRPILKNALEEHSLEKANIIATLPSLSEQDANALIRAARMYQEAVWIIETTPELSWIMLVSAIELVANQWRATTIPDITHMEESSKLADILRKYCEGDQYNQLIAEVAQELAPSLKATKRFLNFLREFLPICPTIYTNSLTFSFFRRDGSRLALRSSLSAITFLARLTCPLPPKPQSYLSAYFRRDGSRLALHSSLSAITFLARLTCPLFSNPNLLSPHIFVGMGPRLALYFLSPRNTILARLTCPLLLKPQPSLSAYFRRDGSRLALRSSLSAITFLARLTCPLFFQPKPTFFA